MLHPLLTIAVTYRIHELSRASTPPKRTRSDRGEGVISTAIAILVMAFLGTLMWYGFKTTFTHAQTKTDDQVELIGQ